jgi:hypothetical protein
VRSEEVANLAFGLRGGLDVHEGACKWKKIHRVHQVL